MTHCKLGHGNIFRTRQNCSLFDCELQLDLYEYNVKFFDVLEMTGESPIRKIIVGKILLKSKGIE